MNLFLTLSLISYSIATVEKSKDAQPKSEDKTQATVQIGLQIHDKNSLELIHELSQYYKQFEEYGVFFEIYYHLMPCYSCNKRHNYTKAEVNCYGGGRYCQLLEDKYSIINGQSILDEILVQSCLKKHFYKEWWRYMNQYNEKCIQTNQIKLCGAEIIETMNFVKQNVNDCVESSFIGSSTKELKDNLILKEYNDKFPLEPQVLARINSQEAELKNSSSLIYMLCSILDEVPLLCSNFGRVQVIRNETTIKINEKPIEDLDNIEVQSDVILLLVFVAALALLAIMTLLKLYKKVAPAKEKYQYTNAEMAEMTDMQLTVPEERNCVRAEREDKARQAQAEYQPQEEIL